VNKLCRIAFWSVSVGLCALGLAVVAWTEARSETRKGDVRTASPPPPPEESAPPREPRTTASQAGLPVVRGEGQDKEHLQHLWDQVQASLKQGAYRDALHTLDAIQSLTPEDSRVALYRSLCERRLQATHAFMPLSPAQLTALHERLTLEEQAQRRAAAQQHALEAQLRNEQAKWDTELKSVEEEMKREEKLKQRQIRADEETRRRAEAQVQRRAQEAQPITPAPAPLEQVLTGPAPQPPAPSPVIEHVPASAGQAKPPTEPASTTSVASPPHAVPGAKPSVELAPVVVTAKSEPRVEEAPAAPRRVARAAPPPGAVQIDADQMSMSPDHRIAIADGNVEVILEHATLTCDHLTFFTDTNDAYAEGHVRFEEGTQVFLGEMVHYNFTNKKGRFLQGTIAAPPWYEHGRSVEHLAEGVYQVTPGYLTSCDHDPPHFKFSSRRAIVFADDKLARGRSVALFVDQLPLIYLPRLTLADRQSPFFIYPGKNKPWEQFALMGYRYKHVDWPGPANQRGTIKLDWRRAFGWGVGADHQFGDPQWGNGLFKGYYNEEPYLRDPKSNLPKGAKQNRYRLLWRHSWYPLPDTNVVTDIEKFSDINFRKELLFREEYTQDDRTPESFISIVTNAPEYSVTATVRRRMNRFQTVTEAFPDLGISVRDQQIPNTPFYTNSSFSLANLQTKTKHSEEDTDVIRANWTQGFSYAMNLFRPIEVTPNIGIRQTYYTKDAQGGAERPQGNRHVVSGQVSGGTSASLKLFRIFPITTNVFGLDINWLRHVLTPTVSYDYVRPQTGSNLAFDISTRSANSMSFALENKFQTKRHVLGTHKLAAYDIGRFVISIPYTFHGNTNKTGGELGDWGFDLETRPWSWLRFESDWSYPTHYVSGSRDSRITSWNNDLSIVNPKAQEELNRIKSLEVKQREEQAALLFQMKPIGYWTVGMGHRYSYNDKTETSTEVELQPSAKWYVRAFTRYTWKEVAGTAKRFGNLREYSAFLVRDLHDWQGVFSYRVDRELGEEIFFTLTLKAYPMMPFELSESYHQPKPGSQSDPFSHVR